LTVGRRVRDQEAKSRKREERQRDRLERLEKMVYAQHEKLDRLEDLVYRVMHRDRVNIGNDQISPPRRSETDATLSNPESNGIDQYSQKDTSSTDIYPFQNL
jgi:hypothetical protein